jgi:beta-alanine degradation protein BauB
MKRHYLVIAMMLLGSISGQAEEKTYPGPHEAAPGVYQRVFDNERVRVSEITFNPGDEAAMHTHAYPHVVYVIEGGQLTLTDPEGKATVLEAKAGDTLWMGAESHEAVNTGTTKVRATVTELKD